VPQPFAHKRIKTKDFAAAGGKNCLVLQDNVDKIRAFEMCRPYLLACETIRRDDRSFDANERQV
jgi:hypothetical protein